MIAVTFLSTRFTTVNITEKNSQPNVINYMKSFDYDDDSCKGDLLQFSV